MKKLNYQNTITATCSEECLKVAPNQSFTPKQIVERYTRGLLGDISITPAEPLVRENEGDDIAGLAFEKGVPYNMKLDILDFYNYSKAQKERYAELRRQIADIGARKLAEIAPPPQEAK